MHKLYYCLQDDLTNFFDVDFLKEKFGLYNNKLFDERFEEFMRNKFIFNIQLNKKIYYVNTTFCGMEQFIMTQFSENEIWFCNRYTDDIYLTNLETFETKKKQIGFRIDSIHFITNYFFILNVDETKNKLYDKNLGNVVLSEHDKHYKHYKQLISSNNKLMYQWNDLTFPKNMTPVMEIYNNEKLFLVNYKGSIMAKIYKYTIEFYNEKFNIVYKINNFLDLINYKSIKVKCCNEHKKFSKPDVMVVKINDNCLFYYESINLIDTKHFIFCNGIENKYCYDFTKEENIIFKNHSLDFFVTNGIPFREGNKVKLLMYEYYPSGSWKSIYKPD